MRVLEVSKIFNKPVAIFVLAVLSGFFLFNGSNSVSATSLEISNSGKVSFGKVQPASTGTLATGQDTLNISTDCTAGYNVYATSTNGGSTSLVNAAANSNNTIATSSNTIGSASSLENNTWGLNTNSTEAANGSYYGLPAYSSTNLPTAIYTGTASSVPVYYGAKVTNALAPGTYTGEVLYSVTVHTSCLNYIVTFDKNAEDAVGTAMEDQAIAPGTSTPLSANTYTRPGYIFLGWSADSSATTATYTDEESVTDVTTGGGFITLYAVWGRTMQDWADKFGCAELTMNDFITLYDSRDNNPYAVKKLADGKCWMVQNLRLTNYRLTSSDSNVSSDFDMTSSNIAQSEPSSWCAQENLTCYNKISVYYDSSQPEYGAYYNWYTATAGTNVSNLSSNNAPNDVCPKGWRLPTGGPSGEFSSLDKSFGGTGEDRTNANTWPIFTGNYQINNNSGFSLAGDIRGGSSLDRPGRVGFYWSSTHTGNQAYFLDFDSNNLRVYPQNYWVNYLGLSIRCVSQTANATGYMQDFDNNLLSAVGQAAILQDKRDGKEYIVKRLQDGKVWMVQNLTVNGVALTPDDTNIDNGTTYYLPRDGGMGNITTASTANSTSGWNFTSGNSSKAIFKFRSKNTDYVNDSDTGYYNFYTATLGFSYYNDGKTSGSSTRDICPKGWRLPKVTDNGNTVNSGSPAEFANLAKSYNPEASWVDSSTSYNYYTSDSLIHTGYHTGIAANGNGYAGFSYNGTYSGTTLYAIGSEGYYLSSSVYDSVGGYYMFFNSSDVRPQVGNNIYNGLAVRCIAKDNMQDVSVASLPEGQISLLKDKRDNQDYTVYRWPSTGTAGSSYPTGMAGYAIMTKDLSLGYITGGSVTRGSNLTLTANDSAAAGTITARSGTGDWSTGSDNNQYINGTNATYGTHSSYSFSAAQKVCPKGWRLPTKTEYDNIVTFMGGSSSTGSSKIRNAPYNFIYGGLFYSNGWLDVGSAGRYHSSTWGDSDSLGYILYFSSSNLGTYPNDRYTGASVRCIAN